MALVRFLALALVVSACASTVAQTTDSSDTGGDQPLVITNHGGSLEGHTPRGFAGMGTGLFVGDNLNPNFPEGDGVQVFLTFQFPEDASSTTSVILSSDALVVSGSPFEDLGPLRVEVVSYDSFGPDLFDTPSLSDPVECLRVDSTGLECDVGQIVLPLLTGGDTTVQLRLLFDSVADNDGQQDLAMFFRSNSNTNEPGLFTLMIDG